MASEQSNAPPSELLPVEEQSEPDLEEQIRQLGKRRVLELPHMVRFHTWLEAKRLTRQSCRVVGESRTGKTYSCDTYHLKHTVTQIPGYAPVIPVVYWHCPEKLSVSGLFTGLLHCLQYQATRGRIPDLRNRLYHVLSSCGVEMLILDEAQRLSEGAISEVRDISDALEISVVLVGTDRLNTVLNWDEQVRNRFLLTYYMPTLNPEELRETTALWEEHILQLPEPSKLTSSKAQDLLLQKTRGCIGILDQILREAAIQTLLMGRTRIEYSLLSQVVKSCSL